MKTKRIMKVEKHGCAYTVLNKTLMCAPLDEDGMIWTDGCGRPDWAEVDFDRLEPELVKDINGALRGRMTFYFNSEL